MSAERGPVISLRETTGRKKRPDGKTDEEGPHFGSPSCLVGGDIIARGLDGRAITKGRFCGFSTESGQVRSRVVLSANRI